MMSMNTLQRNVDVSVAEKSACSVFVGNIPYDATEEQLKAIFEEVGPVVNFRLVYDRETGKPKGYGFCEFKDQETAMSAMRNLNAFEIGGRALRVDHAASERNKEELKALYAQYGGPPAEPMYGEEMDNDKAPEAISKAVASLPPEQMFQLMRQMKTCIQNNPSEARNLLLQNPQLAYALLQAQVIMKIVDPQVALSILYRQNPVLNTLHEAGPATAPAQPPTLAAPPPLQPPPLQAPPMLAQSMQPAVPMMPMGAFAGPPSGPPGGDPSFRGGPPAHPPHSTVGRFDPRGDRDLRDREGGRGDRDLRMPPSMDQDLRGPPPAAAAGGNYRPGGYDPRSRAAGTGPNAGGDPRAGQGAVPATGAYGGDAGRAGFSAGQAAPPGRANPPPPPTVPSAMPAAGTNPNEQEKTKLIMQVLSLTEAQLNALPPEQREGILTLKKQIQGGGR
ncbi:cleavage stimulation factor subunit 2-like [Varroa jacobsoni]|uniref:RRM domain-containing protein n=1 Tax=Varroa destructor TaxID=109461 RepID=A0A7M7JN05_VARDE|nr:cleavage stimulation factor subunit 2-like [Varroa destructor]XP_022695510.1 cleavage stimulation factor subunit 2-like [Varroa jacobsoni]